MQTIVHVRIARQQLNILRYCESIYLNAERSDIVIPSTKVSESRSASAPLKKGLKSQ
jgi:hypothetical protein